jgi:hypothetical protein
VKLSGQMITSLGITLLMFMMFLMGFTYNPTARLIPLIVSGVVFTLALLQFLGDVFPVIRSCLPVLSQHGIIQANKPVDDKNEVEHSGADHEAEETADDGENEDGQGLWGTVFISFASLIVFVVVLQLVGYLIAVPIFLFLFIWLFAKEKILPSLNIAIGAGVFFYILFELILNTRF